MATVKELLRAENDGTLSFGDYTLPTKTKKDNFEFEGDIYKVKTFGVGVGIGVIHADVGQIGAVLRGLSRRCQD